MIGQLAWVPGPALIVGSEKHALRALTVLAAVSATSSAGCGYYLEVQSSIPVSAPDQAHQRLRADREQPQRHRPARTTRTARVTSFNWDVRKQ